MSPAFRRKVTLHPWGSPIPLSPTVSLMPLRFLRVACLQVQFNLFGELRPASASSASVHAAAAGGCLQPELRGCKAAPGCACCQGHVQQTGSHDRWAYVCHCTCSSCGAPGCCECCGAGMKWAPCGGPLCCCCAAGGTVLKLGTARHHQGLLRGIDNVDDVGCFALTELGYGTLQSVSHGCAVPTTLPSPPLLRAASLIPRSLSARVSPAKPASPPSKLPPRRPSLSVALDTLVPPDLLATPLASLPVRSPGHTQGRAPPDLLATKTQRCQPCCGPLEQATTRSRWRPRPRGILASAASLSTAPAP